MRISHGFEDLGPGLRGGAAAIGNFDGVHLGHRALIDAARAAAAAAGPGTPVSVVTFEPHPRRHFQPDAPPFRLTTPEEKAHLIAAAGVERLHVLTFDAALSSMSPETFAREVIAGGLGLGHVVVGEDFRFGHRRAGDAALLRRLGQHMGFGVTILHVVGDEAGDFSSTAARVAVEQGNMADAAAILGRWHAVTGRVRQGDRRGRELGYPTANLEFGAQILPRFGIYAARVEVRDGPHRGLHDGVASIGVRPTFGVNAPNFEVHLFDFDGNLYGAPMAAGLVAFLRAEARFDSVEALIAQMDRDSLDARDALSRARIPHRAPGARKRSG
ncbi:bifunctional riboflavin kinase/FAD synthetase [Limibaculum sp. FT325]|uniref:bifunctional riboflavin kinase/FAD synthetase n=1 Tax=Thermohalobaculum sediminis TaxID=2939436 RepID=UPI0020C03F6E|nr:bifunctional riboflavin kinase/FAD synthetase [Limibaculum sediminis]MCL5777746.1 bifunctional riboflavin kinase/FAD synthetase [Limibaculum sediminis]